MREISRMKWMEIACYYLLGHKYNDSEEEAGISNGSIANIATDVY